jgi:hypothetical protein
MLYDDFRNNPARNRVAMYERMYLRLFTEMACARFEWEGLPESINPRFLEISLFRQALAVFFYENKNFNKYMVLRGAGSGELNYQDEPLSYTVTGNRFVNRTLGYKDCVPIWANYLRIPDAEIALLYATKLAELERTIEINLKAHRKPFFFAVSDTEKLSFMNILRQVHAGEDAVFGTETLSGALEDKIKLFDLKIDKELVLNLYITKSKMWNECMTHLGINNANQEKRERLVVSEVSANNSQVLMARNVALDARRDACERINEKYKLNVSVKWNIDEETIIREQAIAETPMES